MGRTNMMTYNKQVKEGTNSCRIISKRYIINLLKIRRIKLKDCACIFKFHLFNMLEKNTELLINYSIKRCHSKYLVAYKEEME